MLPGQHVGVNPNGTIAAPGSTHKTDIAFFEVKLLVSRWIVTLVIADLKNRYDINCKFGLFSRKFVVEVSLKSS